jgi:hypothetical protein
MSLDRETKPHHHLPPKTYPYSNPLPNIAEDHEIKAFTKIEEVELHHAPHVIDTFVGAAGSAGGTDSSQNNGDIPHHSLSQAPSPAQVIQEHATFDQHQVKDWEEEVSKDKTVAEEGLARV